MKRILLLALVSCFAISLYSQPSDFVILKDRHNRTLKTYYAGEFISAETYNGFSVNGFIKYIRNDSIVIQQQETHLVPTEFGSQLDTIKYTMGFDYREVKKFNYSSKYVWGHKKGFAQVTIPAILMIGGTGYIVLELVNTVYRGESLTDHDKLQSLGIAAGLALTGFVWHSIQTSNEKAGGKYKVVYMKMTPGGKAEAGMIADLPSASYIAIKPSTQSWSKKKGAWEFAYGGSSNDFLSSSSYYNYSTSFY